MTPPPAPRRTEVDEQRAVKHLFALAGFAIYDTSQGFRKERGGTRMTPGLADLVLFHEALKKAGYFEVKTVLGLRLHRNALEGKGAAKDLVRAKAQDRFRQLVQATGGIYGIGGMAEAWLLLESLGLAEPEPTSMVGYRLRRCT